jgi:secreted PhoX family phosphatase
MIRRTLAAAGMAGFHGLAARTAHAVHIESPYGALIPRRAENAPDTLFSLPPDFRYTIVSRATGVLDDGHPSPPLPDAMAAFHAGGELRLVRNHEVRGPGVPLAPGPWSYDPVAGGGTTTIVVDPVTRLPLHRFVSLSGTAVNCAGGPTPWGTWITCEETTQGVLTNFTRPHGYCFEVPAAANTVVPAVPLPALGRFVHEAAAVDPATGIVYLTEDQENAGLYRFIPHQPSVLAAGGKLQMLGVRDLAGFDAAYGQVVGMSLPTEWFDIPDPDPAEAELIPTAVFHQGRSRGGARFRRLEGAWFAAGSLYFTSTNGGDSGNGQVWQYRVRAAHPQRRRPSGPRVVSGELRLLFESPSSATMRMPDNLCASPRGSLVLCEDADTPATFLRGLTAVGTVFPFAENMTPGFEGTELAGATFSPDGETLFVNVQWAGLTAAIWGPWDRGPL